MSYYKNDRGLSLSKGNLKLGNDTLIINMGPATDCPSAKKGLCKLGSKCYALKAEKVYPGCLPARQKQAEYWLSTPAKQIASDIMDLAKKHKKAFSTIKYVRFNESGDFYGQDDVHKLDRVAGYVRAMTGWIFCGYSARSDLDFSKVVSFIVKGSGHEKGNNGQTRAAKRGSRLFNELSREKGFTVCPGDCRSCSVCKVKNDTNVVFPLH
jgi:hypothetical protein